MTTKLTTTQRLVLQHLADGESIFRGASNMFGRWTSTGSRDLCPAAETINILISKGLVRSNPNIDTKWHYLHLTSRGHMALNDER